MKNKKTKTTEELLENLAISVDKGFRTSDEQHEETRKEIREAESRLEKRLDKIEVKVTGLSGRVEVLEDQMRVVRTKLSL